MIECTKTFGFDAAHRLYQYDGLCACLHGHRYSVDVTVEGDTDRLGMVLDFGKIAATIGEWIDENWDHATILNDADPWAVIIRDMSPSRVYEMKGNPTAENMARHLLDMCPAMLPEGIKATAVTVWETPTCRATATL